MNNYINANVITNQKKIDILVTHSPPYNIIVIFQNFPGKNGVTCLFARGRAADTDMPALRRQSGGRGGGKPDLAQGSAIDGAALEAAAEAVLGHSAGQ